MIEIDNTITSFDVVSEKFTCDLKTCKGACCIEGDGGAPLEDDEISCISENLQLILPYIANAGKEMIMKKGFFYEDSDKDKVTMLVNNKECVFTVFDDGIASCGIERAFIDGKINFKKPISCHLYPIRISKLVNHDALNYNKWEICKCARVLGEKTNLRIYEFLKEPLIRKYGKEWYDVLCEVVKENEL
mgnify:CR=1 FL=1